MAEPIDRAAIRVRIARAYTGNRHRDLLGFKLGDEFAVAEEEWLAEASARYSAREPYRRAGLVR